jgi:hypothetical protein
MNKSEIDRIVLDGTCRGPTLQYQVKMHQCQKSPNCEFTCKGSCGKENLRGVELRHADVEMRNRNEQIKALVTFSLGTYINLASSRNSTTLLSAVCVSEPGDVGAMGIGQGG